MEHLDKRDLENRLADEFEALHPEDDGKDPLRKMRSIAEKAEQEHLDNREAYCRMKNGEKLSKEDERKVAEYRSMRKKLRRAAREGQGMSTGTKLDLIVYFLLAVAIYFALLWEYKIDLLPIMWDYFKPNFDHLDDDGNWIVAGDEL
eukprot:TRINITY_DN13365_c0_g1_i1.p1 TRINITY_DN13365_c0_g1~~TRINITY_DN13365_c0_g1_i1.p1  ORF type:complete len:147 (+),score=24.30 TRINITY_DN13365_c0_g1_i1:37-477(+)